MVQGEHLHFFFLVFFFNPTKPQNKIKERERPSTCTKNPTHINQATFHYLFSLTTFTFSKNGPFSFAVVTSEQKTTKTNSKTKKYQTTSSAQQRLAFIFGWHTLQKKMCFRQAGKSRKQDREAVKHSVPGISLKDCLGCLCGLLTQREAGFHRNDFCLI